MLLALHVLFTPRSSLSQIFSLVSHLDVPYQPITILAKWVTCSYPLLLLVFFVPIHEALQSDIECLKSIKASLEDPKGFLSNWDFTNKTEGYICKFTGIDCWHINENKVLNIRFPYMELKGPFPLGLEMCSFLTGLDLSNNQIHGTIPSNISKVLSKLTTLDLSSNNLSGEIPENMASCTFLNVLNLENNQLTGQIPLELGFLGRIKTFRVANNRLAGPVPNFGALTTDVSYANNSGLCGAPSLERCKYPSTEDDTSRDSFIGGFSIGSALFMTLALYLGLFGLPRASRLVTLIINQASFPPKLLRGVRIPRLRRQYSAA